MITYQNYTTASEAYKTELAIRQDVLRTPLGLHLSASDTAQDDLKIHIGAFDGHQLIACVLLTLLDATSCKLSQMAVITAARGQGIGRGLMQSVDDYCQRKAITSVVLHAREHAIGFYHKLGYDICSEVFEEVGIPHRVMRKSICLPG